ncbi:MAG: hypothetical protein KZQ74_09335 [gamma proteobacterium symbiont of Bathyaustriella thionipta]|nr:hypothetical protein [gamma proteobacterium symbiont of Bathyaustriella thionipta]
MSETCRISKIFPDRSNISTHRNEIPTIVLDHIKEQLDISTDSSIQVMHQRLTL